MGELGFALWPSACWFYILLCSCYSRIIVLRWLSVVGQNASTAGMENKTKLALILRIPSSFPISWSLLLSCFMYPLFSGCPESPTSVPTPTPQACSPQSSTVLYIPHSVLHSSHIRTSGLILDPTLHFRRLAWHAVVSHQKEVPSTIIPAKT